PCKAETRRHLVGLVEARVVVPAQPQIEGELGEHLPVVLEEKPVIVVAEMNPVCLGRQAAFVQQKKKSGVNGPKLTEIGDRSEELVVLNIILNAVDLCTDEIPTPFERMAIPGLRQSSPEISVELIDVSRREARAKGELCNV